MAGVDEAAALQREWLARRGEVRRYVKGGEPIQAIKLAMLELRAFSERLNIHSFGIDTSLFFSQPGRFGRALKARGTADHMVDYLASILAERGAAFLALAQPQRAFQDLEAAVEISDAHDADTRAAFESAKAQAAEALEAERRAELARRVPVTILTGFLGAGKTTLLNYILRANHGKRYAVIENEIGKIGIDNQLVDSPSLAARTEEHIVLLDNGCLCCTVRSDLITAVKQILDQADALASNRAAAAAADGAKKTSEEKPLDAILIETTGLADPGPVCKTFYAEDTLRARTRVDGVLTVVDALHFPRQLQRRRSDGAVNESAQQVGFADRLLLNKVDTVEEDALAAIEAEIRSINSACPIVRCSLATKPQELQLDELLGVESFSLDRVLEDMLVPEQGGPPAAKRRRGDVTLFCQPFKQQSRHDSNVATCAFELTGAPLVLERFIQVMNTIRAENAVDLYRYKGTVCVKETSGVLKRAVLQGVHDLCQFEPKGRWPEGEPPRSQLVFIGRNLDEALWGRLLEKTKEGILDEDGPTTSRSNK